MKKESETGSIISFIKQFLTIEIITLTTFILYAWGFLLKWIYFKAFGINIILYITLQEILIEAIFNVTTICILFIVFLSAFIFLTILISYFFNITNFRNNWKYIDIVNKISLLRILSEYRLNYILTLTITFIIFLVFLLSELIWDINLTFSYNYAFPAFMLLFFISYSFLSYNRKNARKKLFIRFVLPFLILSTPITASYYNSSRVQLNNPVEKITYILNDKENISTNNDLCLIGETNSTIFLYSRSLNSTRIINRNSISQTILPSPYKRKKALQINLGL